MHKGHEYIDPLLLVRARFLVFCCLRGRDWCTVQELEKLSTVPADSIARHLRTLRDLGFVDTNFSHPAICDHKLRARITTSGQEALGRHLAALEESISSAEALRGTPKVAAVPAQGGNKKMLACSEVIYAQADGSNSSRVFTADGTYILRGRTNLSVLQELYPQFVRVHRNYLVALAAIRGIRRYSTGTHEVVTDLGPIPVSRRKFPELQDYLRAARVKSEEC